MTFHRFAIILAIGVAGSFAVFPKSHKKSYEYFAPDRGARVVIVPVGKQLGREDYESRIEFRGTANTLYCGLDYSSPDSEHGFGVVRARWTPDSQYFVFSLTSSGGHQAWHAPTQFFSRRKRIIRTLDDYADAPISSPYFELQAPNTVKTSVARQDGKDVAVSFKLDTLPAQRSVRGQSSAIVCKEGLLIHVDQP